MQHKHMFTWRLITDLITNFTFDPLPFQIPLKIYFTEPSVIVFIGLKANTLDSASSPTFI